MRPMTSYAYKFVQTAYYCELYAFVSIHYYPGRRQSIVIRTQFTQSSLPLCVLDAHIDGLTRTSDDDNDNDNGNANDDSFDCLIFDKIK